MLSDVTIAQMSKREAEAQLESTRRAILDISNQAGPEGDWMKVSSVTGSLDEKLAAFNELGRDRDALANHITKLENAEMAGRINQAEYEIRAGIRSPLGNQVAATAHARGEGFNLRHFLETNNEARNFLKDPKGAFSFNIPFNGYRNLVSTLDVAQTEYATPYIEDPGRRPLRVAALLNQGQTSAASVKYLVQDTFGNAAQETAEGELKPLEDLNWTPVTDEVATIADSYPVPKQTLADVPQIDTDIRTTLRFSVEDRLDRQILKGDGVDPNLKGIMNRSGVQSFARTTESNIDAILTGAAMVEGSEDEGNANPSAIIMHPKDWLRVRLLQQVGGPYIMGPVNTAITKQLDGIPVVTTTGMPLHTALVGDFSFATLLMREGLTVTMFTEYADYPRRNLVLLLGELRAAIKIPRPAAFCKVTNLS